MSEVYYYLNLEEQIKKWENVICRDYILELKVWLEKMQICRIILF